MFVLLSFITCVIFIVSSIPFFLILIRNKNIKGTSIVFWFLITLVTSMTLGDFIRNDVDVVIIIPQFINALICFIFMMWVSYKQGKLYAAWIVLMGYSFAVPIIILEVARNHLQESASILILLACADQMFRMFSQKTTQGISINMFLGMSFALALMAIMIFLNPTTYNDASISYVINTLTIVGMAFIASIYQNRKS